MLCTKIIALFLQRIVRNINNFKTVFIALHYTLIVILYVKLVYYMIERIVFMQNA
jgi:hypothetical protein